METRCGYVALLGRPNAGKSTLLNACLGAKIAGVSNKPQTTRNRILGIDVVDENQVIFLDTPGIHKSAGKPKINHMMNREAWSVVQDADLICYLIDVTYGWHDWDDKTLRSLIASSQVPIMILATKSDADKKNVVSEKLKTIKEKIQELVDDESLETKGKLLEPFPYLISSKRPEEISKFRKTVAHFMPEGPFLYDPDDLTDRPQLFVISEMIREQIFRQLGDELPYGISVIVDKMEVKNNTTHIMATIIVSRKAHKPIVIGRGGSRIKSIGTSSRGTLEKHFDGKVFLELFVRVQENWIENTALINQLQGIIDS